MLSLTYRVLRDLPPGFLLASSFLDSPITHYSSTSSNGLSCPLKMSYYSLISECSCSALLLGSFILDSKTHLRCTFPDAFLIPLLTVSSQWEQAVICLLCLSMLLPTSRGGPSSTPLMVPACFLSDVDRTTYLLKSHQMFSH